MWSIHMAEEINKFKLHTEPHVYLRNQILNSKRQSEKNAWFYFYKLQNYKADNVHQKHIHLVKPPLGERLEYRMNRRHTEDFKGNDKGVFLQKHGREQEEER